MKAKEVEIKGGLSMNQFCVSYIILLYLIMTGIANGQEIPPLIQSAMSHLSDKGLLSDVIERIKQPGGLGQGAKLTDLVLSSSEIVRYIDDSDGKIRETVNELRNQVQTNKNDIASLSHPGDPSTHSLSEIQESLRNVDAEIVLLKSSVVVEDDLRNMRNAMDMLKNNFENIEIKVNANSKRLDEIGPSTSMKSLLFFIAFAISVFIAQ
jgi:hypothetical protein